MLLLVISTTTYSQEFEKGKELFQINCAGCHNMEKRVLGPALENTIEMQGREWTSKWIVNNTQLRESGDAHANEVFKEYNGTIMPAFDYLKPEELNALLDYMEGFKKNKQAEAPAAAPTTDGGSVEKTENSNVGFPVEVKIFILITLVLLIVAAILIVTSMRLLDSHYAKIKVTNHQLIKKMNMDSNELSAQVDKIFEKEVSKRVNEKVKTLRGHIDDKLKNFK